jgi:hypothetical protein
MATVKVGSFGWIYIHSHFNLKPMISLGYKTPSQVIAVYLNRKQKKGGAKKLKSLS